MQISLLLFLIRLPVLILILLGHQFAHADSEASNRLYMAVDPGGQFYAKCYPADHYGLKGKTEIYRVGEKDRLLHIYDWYSPQVFIAGWAGNDEPYVVQMGPWQRGHEATHEHLALAFFKGGKLVKRYSTLDIAGSPKNVSQSKSHYTLFKNITGFVYPFIANKLYFEAETHDGRHLTFDPDTGRIVSPEERRLEEELEGARNKIGSLKIEWMFRNKSRYEADKNIKITPEMIEAVAPGQFPQLPAGYRYVPGTVWETVELKK